MPRLKLKSQARMVSAADMRKRIEAGNYKALTWAGKDVWDAAKRGIGQRAPKPRGASKKQAPREAVVEIMDGLYRDLTMLSSGKPRAAGQPIKSWSPARFMYRSILTFWNDTTKSVIIGPYRGADIARLHQFGGTVTLTAYRLGDRAAREAKRARDEGRPIAQRANKQYDYGAILWSQKGFRGMKNWERTTVTKRARYPARPFMRGSAQVEKVIERIRLRFKDTLPIGGRAA